MAELKTHGFIDGIHGRYGKMVVRSRYGKQFLARPPDPASFKLTAARQNVRDRFAAATAYAKAALADPVLRPFYDDVGKTKQIGALAAAVRDYLRPPVVKTLDLTGYTGETGSKIKVAATDDVGLASITLTIRAADGTVIETGPVAIVLGDLDQTYVAKTTVPAGQPVTVEVVAKDRPGNTTKKTEVRP